MAVQRRRQAGRWARTAQCICAVLLLLPQPIAPAVITVTGPCTIGGAIAAANSDSSVGACPQGSGADRIELTANVPLTAIDNFTDGVNGLPSVTSEITIDGNGFAVYRDLLGPAFRLLHVGDTGDLTLEDIDLAFGLQEEGEGGGIFNRGNLILTNTTVSSSGVVGSLSGAAGGGIFNRGTLSLYRSQVVSSFVYLNGSGTYIRGRGGGIFSGPLSSGATLRIEASSLTDNYVYTRNSTDRATAKGGAIYSGSSSLDIATSTLAGNRVEAIGATFGDANGGAIVVDSDRPAALTNATISGNSAVSYSDGTGQPRSVVEFRYGTIRHTTFYGNDASPTLVGGYVQGSIFAASTGDHCSAIIDIGGGNLADDGTCATTIAGTLTGVDPNLAGNGGPTETHALMPGSTASNLAGSCGHSRDQRGASRIAPCDSGAYELIGCGILTLEDITLDGFGSLSTCNTALLAPGLLITSTADVTITAGSLITIRNGLVVEAGAEFALGIDPSLLP